MKNLTVVAEAALIAFIIHGVKKACEEMIREECKLAYAAGRLVGTLEMGTAILENDLDEDKTETTNEETEETKEN